MNTNNTSNADIANGNASAEAIRDLDTLNRLFRKYETAAKKLTEAYNRAFADMDDRVCGFRKAAQEASEKFDEFRKRMAKVKFDMANGEYFYADEKNGQGVFAVKVSRTESCVVRVTAKNREEAERTALAVVEADRALLTGGELVAEDMSR